MLVAACDQLMPKDNLAHIIRVLGFSHLLLAPRLRDEDEVIDIRFAKSFLIQCSSVE